MCSYYRVLGVSRYADLGAIRRAYWSLARRLRLETRPGSSTSALTEIQRAYDTLSDSARRHLYDAQQSGARRPRRDSLLAVPDVAPVRDDDVATQFPSTAAVAGIVPRICAAFFGGEAGDVETHATDVELTPQEAREGIRMPFHLAVKPICPMCGGRGEIWAERCGVCAGTGAGRLAHRLHLPVPPGVRHGMCLRFSVTPPFSAEAHVELRITIQ